MRAFDRDDLDAGRPVERRAQTPSPTMSALAPGTPQAVLRLQRSAGNGAVAALVQRAATVQRDEDDASALGGGTGKPGLFTDSITPAVREVSVDVRQNAREFTNNVRAKLGGHGGQTVPEQVGTMKPDLDENGRITGLAANWRVTEVVPIVRTLPDDPINQPAAQAELAACNALAARLRVHEDGHATREREGRTGWAKSMQGVKDSDFDARLVTLCKKIGAVQRVFDNQEGLITLNSNNALVVSGVDHPEYITDCDAPP